MAFIVNIKPIKNASALASELNRLLKLHESVGVCDIHLNTELEKRALRRLERIMWEKSLGESDA